MTTPLCRICGDEIDPPERARIKPICLLCGEEAAREERRGWCVVQEYQKGGYMFVTDAAAQTTLRETNQKSVRT
jgi:hypothetical protein